MTPVTVIGAGLAGCECAWQLAGRGIPVRLIEMKPQENDPRACIAKTLPSSSAPTPCAAMSCTNAVGLLKEELRRLELRRARERGS